MKSNQPTPSIQHELGSIGPIENLFTAFFPIHKISASDDASCSQFHQQQDMQSSSIYLNPISNFSPRLNLFPPKSNLAQPKTKSRMASVSSFLGGLNLRRVSAKMVGDASSVGTSDDDQSGGFCTLMEYVGKGGLDVGDELVVLFGHLTYACKKIAALVASPFNSGLGKNVSSIASGSYVSDRDKPKPLDVVSNEIILSSLRSSRKVAVMASEEDDLPVWINDDGPYVVVTDPLDGSRNIDASIPTGTIFGIYKRLVELDHLPVEEKAMLNSLQSGTKLVAAGYVLYSSATILCTSFGSGTHAFTLDHSTGDFILTHPNIKIPPRGQIYSVNDARYFDWPEGLRQYIDTVRQGKGKYPKKYSARYICSLVADFHRTILYGGVAMNPRDHLRLVYEANPLSFVVEQAGGRGSDGKSRILSLQPVKLHQRLPLFLGSPEDIDELVSYGNVQQKVNPGYEV